MIPAIVLGADSAEAEYRNSLKGSAEVITVFEHILRRYGFVLNSEKTAILDYPYYVEENFEKLLDGQLHNGTPQIPISL